MNKVILSGNLCREVEVKQTTTGKSVLRNCIAVLRDYKNANGGYDSDFVEIVVWGQSAEYVGKYGNKGDRVELVGRWEARKYEDNNGNPRTAHECIVESIRVFSNRQREEKASAPQNTASAPINPSAQQMTAPVQRKPSAQEFVDYDDQDLPF